MKLNKTMIAVALALGASGAYAAPVMQTCAPLEVQTGATGLNYSMRCEAGAWKLTYSGAVPTGDDTMAAQYRLDAQGPSGNTMAQNRTVILPNAAKLGQALAREAVLLDSGDLALRDCRELNCTKYRPVTGTTFIPPQSTQYAAPSVQGTAKASGSTSANQPAASVVDVKSPADQEISKRLKDAVDQVAQLRAEKAQLEDKAKADIRAVEAKMQLELKTERDAAEGRIAAARSTASREAESASAGLRARIRELEAEVGRVTTALTQAAKDKDMAIKDRETSMEMARGMAAELSTLKRTSADHGASLQAQRSAYEFALASLVAQHNEQVANLNRMMPEMNFRGVIEDLKVPKVSVNGAPATPVAQPDSPAASYYPPKSKSHSTAAQSGQKSEKKQSDPEPKSASRSSVFSLR